MNPSALLKRQRAIANILYHFLFAVMAFFLILGIASHIKRERERQHTPVTIDDVDIKVTTLEKNTYPVTAEKAEKIDNIQYYDVTIGSEKLCLDENSYREKIEGNDQITTEIYVFTAKNKQDYLLKSVKGDTLKTAKFSFLEETPFSDDEIKNLTIQSAALLTHIKYETLGYEKSQDLPKRFYLEKGIHQHEQ